MSESCDLVVYTCITGGYDDLRPPAWVDPQIDYLCFTDDPSLSVPPWRCIPVPDCGATNKVRSRYVKMHPHLLVGNAQTSVYVDGSIEIVGDIRALVDSLAPSVGIALYDHSFRRCAYEEANACAAIGFDWTWSIDRQMNRYRQAGFPADYGLHEANVIIRRHFSPEVISLMECWWNEYRSGIKRDQLSLGYSAWKLGVPIHSLGPSDPRIGHSIFSLHHMHAQGPGLMRSVRRRVNYLYRALLMGRAA